MTEEHEKTNTHTHKKEKNPTGTSLVWSIRANHYTVVLLDLILKNIKNPVNAIDAKPQTREANDTYQISSVQRSPEHCVPKPDVHDN